MPDVYITQTATFLPNEPVANDEMESYLGIINQTASKARRLILRNNKITSRYYALDKQDNPTHTNAELTKNAISALSSNILEEIEVLSCGTSTPDQLLPSHAAMVHGLLRNRTLEINSASGVCNAGMAALKYGYMSVRSGNSNNAVCTGSERVSSWLRADKYENEAQHLKELEQQPIIAFKKDFLRWMLSDGAGAFLLENQPNGKFPLRIEWMENCSFAHELETCMYAGGDKLDDGSIKPWSDYRADEWLSKSVFSIKQDVKLLDENILKKGAESMKLALQKHGIKASEIDYFLPHVSSHYFVDGLHKELSANGVEIPTERWFMNLSRVGNVGAASIYLMLDELVTSGKLQKGQKILLSVPESGRFSYSYSLLTVC
ncbi:MAG: beta-ketoacyl-ACP synthase III [Capnocytophaga sp.]|nr:beta-ketoacyl-ACP synthase III [Capnocytophaga sp.]